jgi:hypothetical protein
MTTGRSGFKPGGLAQDPRTHDQHNLVHGHVVTTSAEALLRRVRLQLRHPALQNVPLHCFSEHMLVVHSFSGPRGSPARRR